MNPTCYDCPLPPLEGRARCGLCTARHAERNRKYRARTEDGTRAADPRRVTLNLQKELTTGKVAKICGVAPRTASLWIDSGRIRGHRLPGSKDRRVKLADLVAFLKASGMDVPGELLPGAFAAVGVPEPVPGYESMGVFQLGGLAASTPIAALVIGDADGLQMAVGVAQAVRQANPAARVALLLDPSNATFEAPAGLFTRVAVRPCDVAALAAELATGAEPTKGNL